MFTRVCVLGLLLAAPGPLSAAAPAVVVERVPDSGWQPKVKTDAGGMAHLAYLRGEAGKAEVVYRHRSATTTNWSDAVTVNSEPGSAIAVGSVRGVQLALGREGRVHFVWNGSGTAPLPTVGSPLLYASLAKGNALPSKQRNLSGDTKFLDGGAAIAADPDGHVYVVWHAAPAGAEGEVNRRVFVARSDDDGSRFAPPVPVSAAGDGVCGCCGLQAAVAGDGSLLVLYRRAATGGADRDMMLLRSGDHGDTWSRETVGAWHFNQCPMSTAEISVTPDGTWLGWENQGRIQIAPWNPVKGVGVIRDFVGSGHKHPALAPGDGGNLVVAWTAGTGWQRGGTLEWSVSGDAGAGLVESVPGVPVWGTVAAYRSAGVTHILY